MQPESVIDKPIPYRYKLFPLTSGVTLLCISVTYEAEAPLGGDSRLWTNLIANAVKRHGNAFTLGILKIGNQTHIPEPISGSMKVIWSTYKKFASDRPIEGESEWPMDSDVASR